VPGSRHKLVDVLKTGIHDAGSTLTGPRCRMAGVAVVLTLGVLMVSACSVTDDGHQVQLAPSSDTTGSVPSGDTSCTPTNPNGETPPGEAPSDYYLGNGEIYTTLWPDGVVIFEPGGPGEIREDGSLVMKWPFFRGEGVVGELSVEGRSLHRPGLRASAEIPDGYGTTGFQACALVFPEPGCWEITARAGEATLRFVTRVESRY